MKKYSIELTKKEIELLQLGLIEAIDYEYATIDAYSNVNDGSEKLPNKNAKKLITSYKKLFNKLELKL